MPTHASHTYEPAIDDTLLAGLHVALEGLAKAMAAKVNNDISRHIEHETATKVEKRVARLLPKLLEQQFAQMFLQNQDAARQRRALLAHLLSAVDLDALHRIPAPIDAVLTRDQEEVDEITSEAAAKLLNVSRTHLNTLVDSGQLGAVRRTAGGHRRISRAVVLQYKAASKERQAKGLDAMAEASQRLGLYAGELDSIPVRGKR